MGIERIVQRVGDVEPVLDWSGIFDELRQLGDNPVVRMIDNLPAFPDETPGDDSQEVRISLDAGMITIRREGTSVRCLIWGNADPGLLAALQRCSWAVANRLDGTIDSLSPAAFRAAHSTAFPDVIG